MSKRILVIEDTEDNRQIIRDLLTSFDYELIEAVDGAEGVAMARDPSSRPDPDGHSAAGHRRLRGDAPHPRDPRAGRVPIIAVTSYALSGDEAKTREAGCDGYIAKPFSPRQLLAKVREFLPE